MWYCRRRCGLAVPRTSSGVRDRRAVGITSTRTSGRSGSMCRIARRRAGIRAVGLLLLAGLSRAQAQPPALLVWYMGNMAPDAADSGGPRVSFTLFDGI